MKKPTQQSEAAKIAEATEEITQQFLNEKGRLPLPIEMMASGFVSGWASAGKEPMRAATLMEKAGEIWMRKYASKYSVTPTVH